MPKSSVHFDAATINNKPAWLGQQIAALQATKQPPAVITPPNEQKPRKTKGNAKEGTPASKGRRPPRIPRTRNGGTQTEAGYWGAMRSGLRRLYRFWKPALEALKRARVPNRGPRGRKWGYICADCAGVFVRKGVQIDHVEPVGRLLSYDDLPGFVRRLTPEDPNAFKVRCLSCHQKKTNSERTSGEAH